LGSVPTDLSTETNWPRKNFVIEGWIPGITPYGDDLDIGFHSVGVFLGISGSF